MKLNNPLSLDGWYRPNWGEWDPTAIAHLDPIADLAGCLEPRLYRIPTSGRNALPPRGTASYRLALIPGSFIMGFMHEPQTFFPNTGPGFTGPDSLQLMNQYAATQGQASQAPGSQGSAGFSDGILFTATNNGAGITVNIPVPPPGQALSVAVAGAAVTVNLATDASGNVTSTIAAVITAVLAALTPATAMKVIAIGNNAGICPVTPQGPQAVAGGGTTINQQANFLMQITDVDLDQKFWSQPIRDDFLSGQPALLEIPYPVAGGRFFFEFWNAMPGTTVNLKMVLLVAEPVATDQLNYPPKKLAGAIR